MKIDCSHDRVEPLHKIVPNPKNNNKHTSEQIDRLAKIIDYQGQRSPIVVSSRSGFIVKGHARLQALQKLGWDRAAVDYQEYESEAQEYADMTADNEIARWAELDQVQLKEDLGDINFDLDMDLLGIEDYSDIEIEELDPQCDEDKVPEVKHDPITKKGDVWLLGDHRVMCGDSTVIDDVDKLMSGSFCDLVITDPPYNIDYEGKTKDALTIKNDNMDKDSFYEFLFDAFTNYYSIMNDGAGIYVFHADTEGVNFRTSFVDAGIKLSQVLIWNKNCMVMGRNDYHWKHEPILYGWKEGSAHKWFSDRKQVSVWDFKRPVASKLHPTMKPVELLEYPITNSTQGSNNIVADLFLGSGSTLIACEKTNRKCFGMELDEHYCDVIVKRWQEYTGKEAVLESSNKTYNEILNGN